MTRWKEGEIRYVQGSARRPYELKNIAGVLSCSCPAWRNQSEPIDRRTCKHLRSLCGDAAEEARIGSVSLPALAVRKAIPPPLLLAHSWTYEVDPTGWWMSEKLDGVRAFWDGKQFLSRNGNRYHAPDWFTAGLPLEPLDGELWIGRKQFQRTVSVVRRSDASDHWKAVRFVIFDAPADSGSFEERLELVREVIEVNQPGYALAHPHKKCVCQEHLETELARIESLGGEGVMLRQAESMYEVGRSSTLLKVKSFHDAEAVVVGHEPGSGRHLGRLGALRVNTADGVRFAVGSGLSDTEREQPPRIGAVIRFRYQELSDGGVPRFPTYVGLRIDLTPNDILPLKKGGEFMAKSNEKRRFEYSEGSSDKFWEIAVDGKEVNVRFGRNGTPGQAQRKAFADEATAQKHADKVIGEKLNKGYRQVA